MYEYFYLKLNFRMINFDVKKWRDFLREDRLHQKTSILLFALINRWIVNSNFKREKIHKFYLENFAFPSAFFSSEITITQKCCWGEEFNEEMDRGKRNTVGKKRIIDGIF